MFKKKEETYDGHGEISREDALSRVDLENENEEGECCLNFLEILAIVFAIIILGFACAYYVALGGIMEDISFESATVCLIVSASLIALSGIITEIGIVRHNKYIFAFEFIMACSAVIVVGTGIAFIRYTRFFRNVARNDMTNTLEEDILSFSLAVFEKCCSENNDLPQSCAANDFVFPCYVDIEGHRENLIDADDACFVLETAGAVSREADGCGGQEVVAFVDEFMGFIGRNTLRMGLINIILGIIILVINGSEGLLCWKYHRGKFNKPRNFDDPEIASFKEKYDEKKRQERAGDQDNNKKWYQRFSTKKAVNEEKKETMPDDESNEDYDPEELLGGDEEDEKQASFSDYNTKEVRKTKSDAESKEDEGDETEDEAREVI